MQLFKLSFVLAVLISFASHANLVTANMSYSERAQLGLENPAAPHALKEIHNSKRGFIGLSFGVEYGNLDDLFKLIDKSSSAVKPSPKPDDDDDGIDISEIIKSDPELNALYNSVKKEVTAIGSTLAIIAYEGYGKAHIGSEIPIVLSNDFLNGSWIFSLQTKGTSKILGIADEINFNKDKALVELEKLILLDESAPETEFDLSGGVFLRYNPKNLALKLSIENDSLMITKASKIINYALGYSSELAVFGDTTLYYGLKPSLYRIGLTSVGKRVGDITDSEELFNEIRNTEFDYHNRVDLDAGLYLQNPHYSLAVSFNHLFEPNLHYPAIDTSKLNKERILTKIDHELTFTLERQVIIEGSLYNSDRSLQLSAKLDGNKVTDTMGDEIQWARVFFDYNRFDSWLSNVRLGINHNFAGNELTYYSVGTTLFKYLNIDLATTANTVKIQGNTLMRGANISIGTSFRF